MSVHLSVRSCYSLLSSTIQIPDLVRTAKEMGFHSVALTDRNVLFAAAGFQHECAKAGIHPIFGMEVDCRYRDSSVPFVLLAKNNAGYRNLILLSSLINNEKRDCTAEELSRYSENCFLIAYGEGGYFDSDLIQEDAAAVKEKLTLMKQELPEFDVAISYQESSLWQIKNALLKRVCRVLKIRTVALNKIYYLKKEDDEIYRVLNGIRMSKTFLDQSLQTVAGRYFRSEKEMEQLYEPEDLERTEEIAGECAADLNLPKAKLLSFPVPQPLSAEQYLTQLCLTGLNRRPLFKDRQVYLKRLKMELDVIVKMHFEDYFLIVWDFVLFAKRQGIYVGPGRGSAAGSLVSYCLGITEIDPIRYQLLFERFLNPERISLPDIDTDFPDSRRYEVIEYVAHKYGRDRVANIITFGTLAAKQVIRDVGKVMNLRPSELDMVTRLIVYEPNKPKITLREALDKSRRLRQIVQAEKQLTRVFEIAMRLEGLPRHMSTHAAGIVLSNEPLQNVIPTIQLDEGLLSTQFTMEYLEERGLIKMDFLGLRNLTIIDEIVRKIQKSRPEFRIMSIPLEDKKTLDVFHDADTIGIFQFESSGITKLLRKIKVTRFSDIVIALALYRPASMESIPVFLENRAHPENVSYLFDELEPILNETCGVMVYQEQAMLASEEIAGFTLSKADLLRKAISKKNETVLSAMREDFLSGSVKNGFDRDKASRLFDLIEKFGGYGYNKSHAVAYAMISYQMAFLKANTPLFFYTSLLDNVIGDSNRTGKYLEECRRRGIAVLAPDVSHSGIGYQIEEDAIRLPLEVIKGIGTHNAETIIEERNRRPFADYFDFVARALVVKISQKMIISLIHSGALDGFHMSRTTMLEGLDEAIRYASLIQVNHNGVITVNLELLSKPELVRFADTLSVISANEKEVLGFLISPDPITDIKKALPYRLTAIRDALSSTSSVRILGLVKSIREIRTKKGQMMAFAEAADETGDVRIVIWPRLYARFSAQLRTGDYIMVYGKMDQEQSLLADDIRLIDGQGKERSNGKDTDRG